MSRNSAFLVLTLVSLAPSLVFATLRADKVHVADAKKTQSYIKDGMFTGGDRAIEDVVIRDIRRAVNPGYERLVIDLEGTRAGEPAAIPRPPYFQVAVTPDEKRVVFTIWGSPKLGFDAQKIVKAFKKSAVISSVELLPKLEDDNWTFVVGLRGEKQVEIFELGSPVRIIADFRTTEHRVATSHLPKVRTKKSQENRAAQEATVVIEKTESTGRSVQVPSNSAPAPDYESLDVGTSVPAKATGGE